MGIVVVVLLLLLLLSHILYTLKLYTNTVHTNTVHTNTVHTNTVHTNTVHTNTCIVYSECVVSVYSVPDRAPRPVGSSNTGGDLLQALLYHAFHWHVERAHGPHDVNGGGDDVGRYSPVNPPEGDHDTLCRAG
jgi:hypothetical protein